MDLPGLQGDLALNSVGTVGKPSALRVEANRILEVKDSQ